MQAKIIYADDFCQFVKERGHAAVGRRLTYDALSFVQNYVFPPSHADLLSVRGTYNKRGGHEDMGETKESESDYDVDKKNEQDS